MKRLALDKNALNNQVLESYFQESRQNKVLLTDYIGIELYKGDDVKRKIEEFLSILGRYPSSRHYSQKHATISSAKKSSICSPSRGDLTRFATPQQLMAITQRATCV